MEIKQGNNVFVSDAPFFYSMCYINKFTFSNMCNKTKVYYPRLLTCFSNTWQTLPSSPAYSY